MRTQLDVNSALTRLDPVLSHSLQIGAISDSYLQATISSARNPLAKVYAEGLQ